MLVHYETNEHRVEPVQYLRNGAAIAFINRKTDHCTLRSRCKVTVASENPSTGLPQKFINHQEVCSETHAPISFRPRLNVVSCPNVASFCTPFPLCNAENICR